MRPLTTIPGYVFRHNLGSVVLASRRKFLDFLHRFGLLALESLNLALKFALRARDNALLFTGGLLRVDRWSLLVSHCEFSS